VLPVGSADACGALSGVVARRCRRARGAGLAVAGGQSLPGAASGQPPAARRDRTRATSERAMALIAFLTSCGDFGSAEKAGSSAMSDRSPAR
jgi:hypothetical protein